MTIKRDEIIEVLEELKEEYGYEFETNFWCCSNCASHAMYDKYGDMEKYIFWHEQDDESAFDRNDLIKGLYLAWGGNAEEIIEAFESAGIKTEWEGSEAYRIAILPEGRC